MKDNSPDSSDFFRIIDQVSDPVFLLDSDFRFIWSNKAYSRYMGLSSKKINSMKLENVIPAEYSNVLKKKYRAISQENPVFDNIYPSVLADGSIIIEKWHNEGVFDDNGCLKYYYCIASLKNSENAPLSLNDSDLISNTLVKSSLIGIIIAIDSEILFINEKAYDLLEMKPHATFDKLSLETFLETSFPENWSDLLSSDTISEASNYEILLDKPEGKKWLSVIRKYQMHNDKKTALFLIEEITDRKNNEIEIKKARNNLADVMRIAKVGYWEKDFINDCWLWSDEIYNIFGITIGTKITEDLLEHYIEKDSMKSRRNFLYKALASKKKSFSYHIEYRILPENDRAKWISGESFYEHAENGSSARFYGWVQDATQRKEVENTLRRAKEQAEESERLKSAFIANMSHEIRTPLNAILGFSDLLTKTSSEAEQSKYKKIINQGSRLLLKIIDDILDISAIESGNLELFNEKIRIDNLLTEIEDFYSETGSERIRLIIKKMDDESVVTADKERLKQVLINLINNAYKYTEKGTITVFCRKNKTKKTMAISVKDTGLGIKPEMIEHIFERFYQIDSFSKGTGLGLSISRSIVTQMGGELSVKSSPGQGSEFTLTLPFKEA